MKNEQGQEGIDPGDASSRAAQDFGQQVSGPSRRAFIRSAVLYAMVAGSGVSVTGCGGGGGDGGGGGFFGAGTGTGGSGGTATPTATSFQHGVASGDPLADRVMLWTRVTASSPGVLSVDWEVSSDAAFGVVLLRGSASTGPDRDYTVKVDAVGLQAGSIYYYRFYRGQEPSPTGRTRTLPAGNVAQVRLGVMSCSNFPAGYFNVCAEAAKRTDLDAVLHLGDYIYEYGPLGYASLLAIAVDRESVPTHETLTLADYRQRHAQYKTDADLRTLHATLPMIAVWDDHDLANNAWSGGAGNHDEATEGSYAARRAAAVQAYHEWLPTRQPDPSNPLKIYRSFDFGNLASLHMLDTRLIARDKQVGLIDYLNGAADAPTRQLIGTEQFDWLAARMSASTATWQVLGQQVLMARMEIPLTVANDFSVEKLTDFLAAQATPAALRSSEQSALVEQRRVPYNLDAWDGYPAARENVLALARSQGKNLISLAGDTHNAWASNLTDAAGRRVGVEFACASVSSPGFERLLPLISNDLLADGFLKMVRDLRFAETSHRGYVVLTLTPSEARADWVEVNTVFSRSYTARLAKSLHALPGAGQLEVLPV